MDADVRLFLAEFVAAIEVALGPNLVGIYLTGSLIAGDFEPASSDIDFLVVTRNPVDDEEFQRLAALHAHLAAVSPWGNRLEGEYAAQRNILPKGGTGTGATIEPKEELKRASLADLTAENLLAIRQSGLTLYGPAPVCVLPAVDSGVLAAALREYLSELRAKAETRRDATVGEKADWLLNIARCRYGLRFGQPSSKPEAATWMAQESPPMTRGLAAALAVRVGQSNPSANARLDEAFRMLPSLHFEETTPPVEN